MLALYLTLCSIEFLCNQFNVQYIAVRTHLMHGEYRLARTHLVHVWYNTEYIEIMEIYCDFIKDIEYIFCKITVSHRDYDISIINS
jgi:hypothetical protein